LDFLVTLVGFFGYPCWISWLPINLTSLDFTGFLIVSNQGSNQGSNQESNQGINQEKIVARLID
jgi:hypothetical protein